MGHKESHYMCGQQTDESGPRTVFQLSAVIIRIGRRHKSVADNEVLDYLA